jgi:hypothetical protein
MPSFLQRRLSLFLTWLIALAPALGCATASPPSRVVETPLTTAPIVSGPDPSAPASPRTFDATAFAANKISALECVQGAAALRSQSTDVGWEALRACVDHGSFRRGNFTELGLVLSGTWDDDLEHRPEAPKLVARLIALRGGDVEGDLQSFHKVRLPAFALSSALERPDMYKGRLVIFRARSEDFDAGHGHPTMRLEETAENASQVWHQNRYRDSGSASSSTTIHSNNRSGRGSVATTWNSNETVGHSSDYDVENISQPTGRSVLGRVNAADPFLEQHRDYVFLGRFDGKRSEANPDDEDEPKQVGVVTILSYFEPSPLMVE